MIRNDLFKLKSSGRVCYPFPWESRATPQPWKPGYMRVMIPLTQSERRNSQKKCHTQIVRNENLEKVKEVRF